MRLARKLAGLQSRIVNGAVAASPKLQRGLVWCRRCGAERRVDAADCLSRGWPKCCGATMTIDAPAERIDP